MTHRDSSARPAGALRRGQGFAPEGTPCDDWRFSVSYMPRTDVPVSCSGAARSGARRLIEPHIGRAQTPRRSRDEAPVVIALATERSVIFVDLRVRAGGARRRAPLSRLGSPDEGGRLRRSSGRPCIRLCDVGYKCASRNGWRARRARARRFSSARRRVGRRVR